MLGSKPLLEHLKHVPASNPQPHTDPDISIAIHTSKTSSSTHVVALGDVVGTEMGDAVGLVVGFSLGVKDG